MNLHRTVFRHGKTRSASPAPILALAFALSGCASRDPDGSREYMGQDGQPVREVSWQDQSGTWFARHSGPGARPTDEAGRPAPLPERTDAAPEPEEKRKEARSRAASKTSDPVAVPDSKKLEPQVAAMLGDWTLDTEATLRANSMFSDEIKDRLRKELEANPFDLSITNGIYVSTSRLKTIVDRYEVVSVRGEVVTLRLTSATRREAGEERKATLIARDGQLTAEFAGAMTMVLTRRKAPDPETRK